MEVLVIGAIAAAIWALTRKPSSPAVTPPITPPGGSQPPPGSGSNPPPGGDPNPPAPAPPMAKPPGLYPPGTPGTYPIQILAIGGDAPCYVIAEPGGQVTQGQSKTLWYGPGTWVLFSARVDTSFLGGIGTAFDHFEGPGVSTRSNPFRARIDGAGYVRGVFAFLGQVGK